MLKPSSYLDYLETLVVSLLHERPYRADIAITDPLAGPSMKGFTCDPYNVREEIATQRAARLGSLPH